MAIFPKKGLRALSLTSDWSTAVPLFVSLQDQASASEHTEAPIDR